MLTQDQLPAKEQIHTSVLSVSSTVWAEGVGRDGGRRSMLETWVSMQDLLEKFPTGRNRQAGDKGVQDLEKTRDFRVEFSI